MERGVLIAFIGLAGVLVGAVIQPLVSYLLDNRKLTELTAERDILRTSYDQLTKDHLDLVHKDLSASNSRRLISFQLLALDSYLLLDKIEGRAPILEILGINATGAVHQGREMIRDILKSKKSGGYGGKVRVLLLDPNSEAFRGESGRMNFENDKVGRIAAEMNASLYILADIRTQVGPEAFANLELRLHSEHPDRSLLMLDVGASTIQPNSTDDITEHFPNGVVLENPYSTLRGERGLEGESHMWRLARGQGEKMYREDIEYYDRLWSRGRQVSVPAKAFDVGFFEALK